MPQDKGLSAHPDKTSYIVCGSRKYKQKAANDIKNEPLKFGSFVVKELECDKYLGQMLHTGGLERSALAKAQDRAGRIKGATMEIKSIIEDFKMQSMGGMMATWELWERALIPSLLSGSGTWIGKCQPTIDLCDGLQYFFWRVMMMVPESCPKIALVCETKMKWRIWQEKLFLILRIKNLGPQTGV